MSTTFPGSRSRAIASRAAVPLLAGAAVLGAVAWSWRGAQPVTTHAVQIRDFAFDPSEIRVAVGDTVVFTNRDGFLHTVSDDGRAWDSGTLATNESWTLIANGPSSFHCAFHPSMRGELIRR